MRFLPLTVAAIVLLLGGVPVFVPVPAWAAASSATTPVTTHAETPVTDDADRMIDTKVMPVQHVYDDWRDRTRFDWDEHGFGVQLGLGLYGDIGDEIEGVGRDVGVGDPPGPILTGLDLLGWFAVSPSLRVGAWLSRYSQNVRESYGPPDAGQFQTFSSRLRAGGALVDYVWPWDRYAVYGGVGFGLGNASFDLTRVLLANPGDYDEYTTELRNATILDTWSRQFSGNGPAARARTGIEIQIVSWLAFGVDAGWSMIYVPSGNLIDEATGANLQGSGDLVFHGWTAGLWLSSGRWPVRSER